MPPVGPILGTAGWLPDSVIAALLISSREWLLPAAIFLVVATGLLVWTYRGAPAQRNWRMGCAALKLLGLVAVAACLLEPLWSGKRARPGANHLAVLADNSQGLQIKDRGDSQTRGQWLTNLLTSRNATWLPKLEEHYQVRRYSFDTRLQATRDFSELTFDGRASSMGTALRALADRFRGQPLAGVLLLTDGNATDLPDGSLDVSGLPPIYPVVVGRSDPIHDLAIQKVAVSQTAFEDAPVTLQADVAAGGYSGRTITAKVLDQTGQVVEEQSQRAARDSASFRFQLRPERAGVSFYRVRVAARDEQAQFEQPDTSAEATLANNSRVFVVDRGRGPYRILYLAGRPNWEFKFLNRALAEDDQVELVPLIRVARREPKFEFRGRLGETSNPLFRGWDRKDEETERYDQPVLKCPNPKFALEMTAGFPRTADTLFRFHAVILDDIEAEFFTRDQMALLQKFVSERGGGFLMLGGAESFRQGKYEHTPVGDMLPVYLDPVREAQPVADLRLSLTPEGWLQPWARLRDNESAETKRLGDMPALQVLNTIRGVKPGARVIAEVQDQGGRKHPALAEQRFGHGRVAALLLGDWWRWGLRDEETRKDLDKAWRQLARWLTADVLERVELAVERKPGDPNQAVTVQVRARDKDYQPLDNAFIRITVAPVVEQAATNQTGRVRGQDVAGAAVSDPFTNRVSFEASLTNGVPIQAEPSLTEAGLYEATYIPRTPGGHLVSVQVTDAEGLEVGQAQAGWAAEPAAEEFRSLTPNVALLETIARQTGGKVIEPGQLDAFATGLPQQRAPVMENWSFPLWHQPAVLLFALACFAAEWGLRRWKGLA